MSTEAEPKIFKGGGGPEIESSQSAVRRLQRKVTASLVRLGGALFGKLSPVARYLLVGFLIAAAAFSSWYLSVPRANPDLFAPVLSTTWWISPLERGAVLRLPIINTSEKPVTFATDGDRLLLGYDKQPPSDERIISISASGTVISGSGGLIPPVDSNRNRQTQLQTIYFDYDSSVVRSDATKQVEQMVKRMKLVPDATIVLEGHTGIHDEFSIEYNLALAERMAQAVKALMVKLGADTGRISTISYGAEKPADLVNDDRNRRVVMQFEGSLAGDASRPEDVVREADKALLEWRTIEPPVADAELMVIDDLWALGKDRSIVLTRSSGKPWSLVAVNSAYARKYLEQREPAFAFSFNDTKFRWRKKSPEELDETIKPPGRISNAPSASTVEWSEERFHKTYPAPLAYLIIGVFGLLSLVIISARTAPVAVDSNNIVEHFASDAPITKTSSDCLGFARIAKSISQFLRNEKTIPPLTIAVTGQWGCGKSSLMQLLQADLKAHRLRPIWLNAWHHQNESQFLYGLLNAIRRHGMPSYFSGAHVLFRMRLLTSRIKQKPFYALLLAALLAIPIGFLSSVEKGVLPQNWFSLWLAQGNLAVIGTALPFLLGLMNLSGEKLTHLASGKLKKHFFSLTASEVDLRSAAGVREQFVQEFRHFCHALGVSTLTVFIDDLDRCSEKRVMDVLETVNFLVSSGKCIVIFGMDRGPVERAVANYYQQSYKNAQPDELILFARRYLEKLVNIEVPVPTAGNRDITRLVAPESGKKIRAKKLMTVAASIVLLVGFTWLSLYLGTRIGKLASSPEPQELQTATQNSDNTSPGAELTQSPVARREAARFKIIARQEPGKADYLFTYLPIAILMSITGFAAVENYRQRKRVLVYDSEDFSNAIHDWMLLMGTRNATPRRIKRFVNRARFLTMRLRNDPDNVMDETDLVALAGLHELNPKLLNLMESGETEAFTKEMNQMTPGKDNLLDRVVDQYPRYRRNKMVSVFKSWVQGFDIR